MFWCVLPARNRQTKVDTKFWYANVWNITLRTAQPRNTGPNEVTNFRAPELTKLFSWQCCAFEFGRPSKRATALVPDKLPCTGLRRVWAKMATYRKTSTRQKPKMSNNVLARAVVLQSGCIRSHLADTKVRERTRACGHEVAMLGTCEHTCAYAFVSAHKFSTASKNEQEPHVSTGKPVVVALPCAVTVRCLCPRKWPQLCGHRNLSERADLFAFAMWEHEN